MNEYSHEHRISMRKRLLLQFGFAHHLILVARLTSYEELGAELKVSVLVLLTFTAALKVNSDQLHDIL
jgi:hypothetical protein